MARKVKKSKNKTFSFVDGTQGSATEYEWVNDVPENKDDDKLNGLAKVRKSIERALNARNVAFLLGAGCSSFVKDGAEYGIPTMEPLANEYAKLMKSKKHLTSDERNLIDNFGVKVTSSKISSNLEKLMEVLFGIRFIVECGSSRKVKTELAIANQIINKVQTYILEKCTNGKFHRNDDTVLGIYESFYRKLMLRNRTLPTPWIFTTNYDLFNETALDRLGLPYGNGFSGVVERRFNPATFRYSLAEQIDITNRRWTTVNGYVQLCKLHGSINWVEDDHGLFPIRELSKNMELESANRVMIYPTPAKQNSSFGSPYADLFREFQSRIVRDQSVLFVLGYAFGDQHINNIIYQALTLPTFRLVIFANPEAQGEISKLRQLNDSRIWIIGGDGPNEGQYAHYFGTAVEEFFPRKSSENIDRAVRNVVEKMLSNRDKKL